MTPTTTKRTTTAKQTKTKTATAPPATRTPQRTVLNETQERIIDAVSDMLTNGAHDRDVDMLLEATMRHLEHRCLDELFSDKLEDRDRIIKRRVDADFDGWKTDLAIAWRANKRKDRPESDAKTISEMIREQQRELLIDSFDDFLRDATPEESRLLEGILTTRNGGIGHSGAVKGVEEIPLGNAFGIELGQNETYIRIPRGFRGKTQKYIDALQAIEDKAA